MGEKVLNLEYIISRHPREKWGQTFFFAQIHISEQREFIVGGQLWN